MKNLLNLKSGSGSTSALPAFAAIALADLPMPGNDGIPVERDENGVPVAWRLFAYGPVRITKQGQQITGEFTREAADIIMDHFRAKGSKIPLDSFHFAYHLAEKLGTTEYEISQMLHDQNVVFGFVDVVPND